MDDNRNRCRSLCIPLRLIQSRIQSKAFCPFHFAMKFLAADPRPDIWITLTAPEVREHPLLIPVTGNAAILQQMQKL